MRKLDLWINQTKQQTPNAWVPSLKGSLVGNGVTHYKYDGIPAYVPMAYYHGLIDDEIYDYLNENCDLTFYDWNLTNPTSPGCTEAMKTFVEYTRYVNPYDVFGKCYRNPVPNQAAPAPYES